MPTPRILKHWFVATTPGESGTHFFTVRSKTQPTRETLADLGIVESGCYCEHDCCGHIQYGSPYAVRRNKRNEWLVDQYAVRNV